MSESDISSKIKQVCANWKLSTVTLVVFLLVLATILIVMLVKKRPSLCETGQTCKPDSYIPRENCPTCPTCKNCPQGESCKPNACILPENCPHGVCSDGKTCQEPLQWVEFRGVEINGEDLGERINASKEQCRQKCIDNSNCKAYVVNASNSCWLKSFVNVGLSASDRTAYVRAVK